MRFFKVNSVIHMCVLCVPSLIYLTNFRMASSKSVGSNASFAINRLRVRCGNNGQMKQGEYDHAIGQCGRELIQLLQAQFPWRPTSSAHSDRTMDPLDPLDNFGDAYTKTMHCAFLRIGDVQEGCLMYAFSGNYLEVHITMNILCKAVDRLKLMRSLQGLSATSVLKSLGFRAWKRCGADLLTNQTVAMRNALFVISDIKNTIPLSELLQKIQKSLYCVPDDHLHCFLSDIGDLCGGDAMSLFNDYIMRMQNFITDVWLSGSINKDTICRGRKRQYIRTSVAGIGSIKRNSATIEKVTALETFHGQQLWGLLKNLTAGKGICHPRTADIAYRVLLHSLFVQDEPVRFNLFHFAHGLTTFRPYSVPCHMGDFAKTESLWHLLRNVCPSPTRSYHYPLTVLIEGYRLYDLFDSQFAHCQWEDMLIGIYARAAAITKSPNTGHWVPGGSNYLLLDGMYEYYGVKQWADYTRRPLDLIRQSLDEITFKCGQGMTSALKEFYNKLEYYMFDSILQQKSLNS